MIIKLKGTVYIQRTQSPFRYYHARRFLWSNIQQRKSVWRRSSLRSEVSYTTWATFLSESLNLTHLARRTRYRVLASRTLYVRCPTASDKRLLGGGLGHDLRFLVCHFWLLSEAFASLLLYYSYIRYLPNKDIQLLQHYFPLQFRYHSFKIFNFLLLPQTKQQKAFTQFGIGNT